MQQHLNVGALLEVELLKKCTRLWREARFQVKMLKHFILGHFGKLCCWKSARRCGAKHVRFPSQNVQSTPFSDRFWTLNRHFSWQAQWVRHLHKSEPNVRALQQFKNDGRCGTFEDGLQLCMSRGRRSTRDISIRHVRRPGRGFPDTLEHQIAGFTKIIYPHLVMQIFFLGAHYYQS